MAKSDLLKEAIADARTVKETAIANAKIALEEAFTPRIHSMLSTKLSEQLDDEEDVEMMGIEDEMPAEEPKEMDMDAEMDAEPEVIGVGVDLDMDGDYDIEGELGMGAEEEEMDDMTEPEMDEPEMGEEDMDAEYDAAEMEEGRYNAEDMNLEDIIRELEEGIYEGEMDDMEAESADYDENVIGEDIDAIIESILAEEDAEDAEEEVKSEMVSELNEAYATIEELRSVINEVNLLNAKLLYTNKLFRNFELNESQKMKVIENFDRAANTREVKLVFSTLAESFNRPTAKKRVVKESYASKPTQTTAPSKATKQVLSEGNELANRWKKLAGLI
jgi:hypothetical protein